MNKHLPQPARLPYAFAKAHGVILAGDEAQTGPRLYVREGAPVTGIAEIRRVLGLPLRLQLCKASEFERHLVEAYSHADQTAAEVADDIGQDLDLNRLVQELPPIEDLLESEDDAPIIRMINALFTQAVREDASDIHVEAFEQHSTVRFRIDGVLRDVIHPHRALHAAMASRIKIMAQLDIAEKRMPQDGRITIRIAGRPTDVRVSTIPTSHGERIVMRLLDKDPAIV